MAIKISKLKKELRPDIQVRRSGIFGLGRKIEFAQKGGKLSYSVERGAFKSEGDLAAAINSRMPGQTMIPRR